MRNEKSRARSPFFNFAFYLLSCLTFAVTFPLGATTTNDPVTAEREGRALARQLCELRPEANFTNTGKLIIRIPKKRRQ